MRGKLPLSLDNAVGEQTSVESLPSSHCDDPLQRFVPDSLQQ